MLSFFKNVKTSLIGKKKNLNHFSRYKKIMAQVEIFTRLSLLESYTFLPLIYPNFTSMDPDRNLEYKFGSRSTKLLLNPVYIRIQNTAFNSGLSKPNICLNTAGMCRKVEALTSSLAGSGMDKPSISFFGYSNGGTYSLRVCNSNGTCCRHVRPRGFG